MCGDAAGKLRNEWLSIRCDTDVESDKTNLCGMGEVHWKINVDRMKRECSVD